jgi:hypothetical protein
MVVNGIKIAARAILRPISIHGAKAACAALAHSLVAGSCSDALAAHFDSPSPFELTSLMAAML